VDRATQGKRRTNYRLFPDLSAAVDVYSDWIDACDSVAKDVAGPNSRDGPSTGRDAGQGDSGGDTGGLSGGGMDDEDEDYVAVGYDDDF
jgi:transcription elongation factor Elf1